MEVPKIDIDGVQYEKPTKNLLGLMILEYVIWFMIGFLIIIIYAGTSMSSSTYDPVAPDAYGIAVVLFWFACMFVIGPICGYFGVITRPFLMRPSNIIKWNERKRKKSMLYQAPAFNLNCTNCNRSIPLDAKICPYCSTTVEQTTAQNVNQQNIVCNQAVIQIKKQKAVKHIITGFVLFIVGLAITLGTMASASPIAVIMWGAIVFGFIEMIYGIIKYVTN